MSAAPGRTGWTERFPRLRLCTVTRSRDVAIPRNTIRDRSRRESPKGDPTGTRTATWSPWAVATAGNRNRTAWGPSPPPTPIQAEADPGGRRAPPTGPSTKPEPNGTRGSRGSLPRPACQHPRLAHSASRGHPGCWGTRTRTETARLQRPAGCRLPHPPQLRTEDSPAAHEPGRAGNHSDAAVESYGSVGYGGVAREERIRPADSRTRPPTPTHREDPCRLPSPRHRAARSP